MKKFLKYFIFNFCILSLIIYGCSSDNTISGKLQDEITDIYCKKFGNQEKQISYLKNFNHNNKDYWEALLKYGNLHTYATPNGRSRIIWFVNSDIFKAPDLSGNFNDDLRKKIFAMFAKYANGKKIFDINPFGTFKDEYYSNFHKYKKKFAEKYPEISH